MTLDKLIYDVREALKEYSDDNELSDRYITYLYDIKRAKYIRQSLNNSSRPIDISVKQSLCTDLEVVSASECGVNLGCDKLVRTAAPLPTPLQLHDRTAITRVGSVNRIDRPFNFVSRDKAVYAVNAPFPNSVYTFLHSDGHLYILSGSKSIELLKCISVEGVFEHPLELAKFKDCCDCENSPSTTCFDSNTTDYPIQPHYIDIIRSEIINELAQLKNIQEDTTNDAINE